MCVHVGDDALIAMFLVLFSVGKKNNNGKYLCVFVCVAFSPSMFPAS